MSTGVAALMQSLANKGFNCNDANYSGLVSTLANIQTTADIRTNPTVVPFSTNPVFNAVSNTKFEITLVANVNGSTLANVQHGDVIFFQITQGGSGGYAFTWPANCISPPDVGSSSGAVTVVSFYVGADLNARALSGGNVSY